MKPVVRIRNVNTDSLIEAVVQTPDGEVQYDGDTAIDGVPGTAAPVVLNFSEIVGSKTGALAAHGQGQRHQSKASKLPASTSRCPWSWSTPLRWANRL